MSFKIMIQANTPESLADQAIALADYFKNKTQPVQSPIINNTEPTVAMKETSTAPAAPTTDDREAQIKRIGELDRRNQQQVSQPAAAPANGQADLDANGLPWDKRIHASSKNKNANGTWRTRRGLDKAELEKVEAELRNGRQPLPDVPEPMAPAQTAPQAPVQQPFSQQAPPVQQPTQPMPQPTPAPAQDAAYTFDQFRVSFIDVIASLQQQGKINQEWIASVKNYFGIQELWQLTQNDAQLQETYKMFTDNGLIKGA